MTKIEWVKGADGIQGKTWNPVVGCTVLTPGCTNCYAMKMAARLEAMGQPLYAGLTKPSKAGAVWTGKVRLAPESTLLAPLRRRKPTTYFVNSMSDLFHEDVPDPWILEILDIMRRTSRDGGSNCGRLSGLGEHTYQVLTKRTGRLATFMKRLRFNPRAKLNECALYLADDEHRPVVLKNLWLGVSCEDQQRANERIPHLLATPAAVRFVSAEPLLGPINFQDIPYPSPPEDAGQRGSVLTGHEVAGMVGNCVAWIPPLDWIIVGGESGHDARPFDVEWADSIVAQCSAAGVKCFVKQLGAAPLSDGYPMHLKSAKGGDWNEWPDRLRVREFPQQVL